jgi:hypothetical protein
MVQMASMQRFLELNWMTFSSVMDTSKKARRLELNIPGFFVAKSFHESACERHKAQRICFHHESETGIHPSTRDAGDKLHTTSTARSGHKLYPRKTGGNDHPSTADLAIASPAPTSSRHLTPETSTKNTMQYGSEQQPRTQRATLIAFHLNALTTFHRPARAHHTNPPLDIQTPEDTPEETTCLPFLTEIPRADNHVMPLSHPARYPSSLPRLAAANE